MIWRPKAGPSPFVTETATKVFGSTQEAMEFFHQAGYVPTKPAGSLFA